MGKIFNKVKDKAKDETIIGSAPESEETPGEQAYMDNLNKSDKGVASVPEIREVLRCMSQTQINNLIIDMDMKLNYIISKLEE